jgi:hypothetical protein
MTIKAYAIIPDRETGDGALLVFADSRNRARYVALTHGTWEYDDYWRIKTRRAPEYDGAFDTETVVDTNDDLPAGHPAFYDDTDCSSLT